MAPLMESYGFEPGISAYINLKMLDLDSLNRFNSSLEASGFEVRWYSTSLPSLSSVSNIEFLQTGQYVTCNKCNRKSHMQIYNYDLDKAAISDKISDVSIVPAATFDVASESPPRFPEPCNQLGLHSRDITALSVVFDNKRNEEELKEYFECRYCKRIYDLFLKVVIKHGVEERSVNTGSELYREMLDSVTTFYKKRRKADKKNSKYISFMTTCQADMPGHAPYEALICPRTEKLYDLCPECIRIGHGSTGEAVLRKILEDVTGLDWSSVRPAFLQNPDTGYNLELDCYNEKLKTAFEFQGKQHYEPVEFFGGLENFKKQVYRDSLKKTLCEQNSVRLIEIDGRNLTGKTSTKKIEDFLRKEVENFIDLPAKI